MEKLFSICMCNYNMADTLKQSITSIASQLDDRFEIVIVDDGSTDSSVHVIESLAREFPFIRTIKLDRDQNRRLGITRNISIQNAVGKYVLLHLDCDDIYAPYIKDFCEAFLQIESAFQKDILLSGQHIQMGRRDFLLELGPYRNIFRGEDRDLWTRLSLTESYIPFNHIDFCTRLPKSLTERLKRAFFYTWDHLVNDFSSERTLSQFYYYELERLFTKDTFSKKLILYKLSIAPLCWITSKFKKKNFDVALTLRTPEDMLSYRQNMGGTLTSLVERHGKSVDWSKISQEGRPLFDIT